MSIKGIKARNFTDKKNTYFYLKLNFFLFKQSSRTVNIQICDYVKAREAEN